MKTKDSKKIYVHMLNGTLCATERALCCLVENYQTPDVRRSFLFFSWDETDGSLRVGSQYSATASEVHAGSDFLAVRRAASGEEGWGEET